MQGKGGGGADPFMVEDNWKKRSNLGTRMQPVAGAYFRKRGNCVGWSRSREKTGYSKKLHKKRKYKELEVREVEAEGSERE